MRYALRPALIIPAMLVLTVVTVAARQPGAATAQHRPLARESRLGAGTAVAEVRTCASPP